MFQNVGITSISNGFGIQGSLNPDTVCVDGKIYSVQKVPDNGLCKSIMPRYKEVVVIDGKQYDVQTVNDPIASDGTKKVVVIDGKQYDVVNESQGLLKAGFQNAIDPIFKNNDNSFS